MTPPPDFAELWDRFRRRDRNALARLLTFAGRGQHLEALRAHTSPARSANEGHPSRVVAFTGSGGVGKSTLVGKLIEQARKNGQSVAVLACDPESPLTGGALL